MTKHVVEIFQEIVDATKTVVLPVLQTTDPNITTLHYEHGHYSEIDATLRSFDKSESFYNKKYPLIAVFEDIAETVKEGYNEAKLTIIICFSSNSEDRSGDRYQKVINPILEPVYKELLRQIRLSGYFMEYNVRHTKIVRPYWGVQGEYGNRANVFSDFLDAIEMRDVRLRVYPQSEC